MSDAASKLAWSLREPPLAPHAVVARGGVVPHLAQAVVARVDTGVDLRAAGNDDWLLVLGEPADLPWADGVTYLGWAEGLLIPTTLRIAPAADLVRLALRRAAPDGHDLIVVLGSDVLTLPMPSRPVDRTSLPVGAVG